MLLIQDMLLFNVNFYTKSNKKACVQYIYYIFIFLYSIHIFIIFIFFYKHEINSIKNIVNFFMKYSKIPKLHCMIQSNNYKVHK